MVKGLLLGATMAIRILLCWALGMLLLWAICISGMGGVDAANWVGGILLVASGPVILVAVILCLAVPTLFYDQPFRYLLYGLAVALLISAFFGGLLGAIYAVFAALPCILLFLLSMLILPLRRTRMWFA
jgi:hypothetical protein